MREDDVEQLGREPTGELAAANAALRHEIAERMQDEERLQLLIDTIPAMVFTALPDGTVDLVNQRWLHFMGLSLEDVQGWKWDFPIHPEDRARSIDHWRSTMAAGIAGENELRVRRADGVYRWILGRFVPLRNAAGQITKWYGVSTDIDDRKRAEELLHAREQEFRAIVENAPDHIIRFDRDFRRTYANPAVAQAYDLPPEALIGTPIGSVIHDAGLEVTADELTYIRQQIADVFASGASYTYEMNWPTPTGRRYYSVRLFPERDLNGTVTNVLSIARDITERIQIESERTRLVDQLQHLSRQLIQAQETERRTIARELHDELGQRLTALGMLINMSHQLPPDQYQTWQDQCQALIADMIEEVGNLALNLRPAILDDLGLVPALGWLFGRYTLQTQVVVRFEQAGLEEQRFRSDVEITTYRIVQEALTNVARHAGVTEVTVRLWTDAEALTVTIADQGRGFKPQTIDPYSSSGLTGMQERAALVGGAVTIESAAGTGTRVTARLPQ